MDASVRSVEFTRQRRILSKQQNFQNSVLSKPITWTPRRCRRPLCRFTFCSNFPCRRASTLDRVDTLQLFPDRTAAVGSPLNRCHSTRAFWPAREPRRLLQWSVWLLYDGIVRLSIFYSLSTPLCHFNSVKMRSLLLCCAFLVALAQSARLPKRTKSVWNVENFKSFVTFGDSYTDENRLNYFATNNGSAPPPGTLLPESFSTAGGGRTWPRYVVQYTGDIVNGEWVPQMTLYNYAVSGAVCSNEITPRSAQPYAEVLKLSPKLRLKNMDAPFNISPIGTSLPSTPIFPPSLSTRFQPF